MPSPENAWVSAAPVVLLAALLVAGVLVLAVAAWLGRGPK